MRITLFLILGLVGPAMAHSDRPVVNLGMGGIGPQPRETPRVSPRDAPSPPVERRDYDEILRDIIGLQLGQPITPQDMERLEQMSEWYRGTHTKPQPVPGSKPNNLFLNNSWDR